MGLRCKHPWSPQAFCIPFIPPFNVYLIVFNSTISIPPFSSPRCRQQFAKFVDLEMKIKIKIGFHQREGK